MTVPEVYSKLIIYIPTSSFGIVVSHYHIAASTCTSCSCLPLSEETPMRACSHVLHANLLFWSTLISSARASLKKKAILVLSLYHVPLRGTCFCNYGNCGVTYGTMIPTPRWKPLKVGMTYAFGTGSMSATGSSLT